MQRLWAGKQTRKQQDRSPAYVLLRSVVRCSRSLTFFLYASVDEQILLSTLSGSVLARIISHTRFLELSQQFKASFIWSLPLRRVLMKFHGHYHPGSL